MKEYQWALIAGSAEGLGKAFTELLAGQGFNLILVDHNEEALGEIAKKVVRMYGIKTETLCIDLAGEDAWKICMDAIRDVGCRMQDAGCGMLVYCAAMSEVKPFLDHDALSLKRFIEVNNRTALLLVHAFAHHLREQGKPGNILLMSSMAGLLAPVYVAPYAASKAYLIALGRSLHSEFRPFNIGITVCCSGIINTPKFLESSPQGKVKMEDPAGVAAFAVKNCGKKAVCIHRRINRLNYFILSRILTASLSAYFVNTTMRKIYPTFSR